MKLQILYSPTEKIVLNEHVWKEIVNEIEASGDITVHHEELAHPFGSTLEQCHARAVIKSVFEVQGLKGPSEGESILPAIESLVSKYAEIKHHEFYHRSIRF